MFARSLQVLPRGCRLYGIEPMDWTAILKGALLLFLVTVFLLDASYEGTVLFFGPLSYLSGRQPLESPRNGVEAEDSKFA